MKRFSITSLLLLALTLLTLALTAAPAEARTFNLAQNVSKAKLAGICGGAGGTYVDSGAHGYGCITYNCDGKGNTCSVGCDKNGKHCTGTTPNRIFPGETLLALLTPHTATPITPFPGTCPGGGSHDCGTSTGGDGGGNGNSGGDGGSNPKSSITDTATAGPKFGTAVIQ